MLAENKAIYDIKRLIFGRPLIRSRKKINKGGGYKLSLIFDNISIFSNI